MNMVPTWFITHIVPTWLICEDSYMYGTYMTHIRFDTYMSSWLIYIWYLHDFTHIDVVSAWPIYISSYIYGTWTTLLSYSCGICVTHLYTRNDSYIYSTHTTWLIHMWYLQDSFIHPKWLINICYLHDFTHTDVVSAWLIYISSYTYSIRWWRCVGCLILRRHFPPKSPIINGSFAKIDLQLKASYASSLPCTASCIWSVISSISNLNRDSSSLFAAFRWKETKEIQIGD